MKVKWLKDCTELNTAEKCFFQNEIVTNILTIKIAIEDHNGRDNESLNSSKVFKYSDWLDFKCEKRDSVNSCSNSLPVDCSCHAQWPLIPLRYNSSFPLSKVSTYLLNELCDPLTYIYTYIHTYVHIYIYTYIYKYTHTKLHTNIHTVIHTYIHTYIHHA